MSDINYWKEQKGFPGLQRKLKILVFVPNYGGCSYYRVLMPFAVLAKLYPDVVEVKFDPNPLRWNEQTRQEEFDPEVFDWPDIIVTNNIPDKGMNYLARVLGKAKEHHKLFWFDTDDLLTELYPGHRLEAVYKEQKLSENTKFVYFHSDLVSVTQEKFAQRVRGFCGPSTLLSVIKNAIDYTLPCWNAQKVEVPKNRFTRVGWAGGIHHEEDVKEFAGVPWIVNQKVGKEKVRWDFYGKPPLDPTNPEKWQHDVWKNYERTLAAGFKAYKNYTINPAMNPNDSVDKQGRTIPGYGHMFANMDMAIAPLQMNSFNDCYARGQEVIMFDGTLKAVENIIVGDKLLGPDSTPRTVLRLSSGINDMYEVTPARGKPFKVTKNHILCLKANDKILLRSKPKYVEIPLEEYVLKSTSYKYNYRLYKSEAVQFDNKNELPIDPYILGAMLGDGTFKGTPKITTMDEEVQNYFESYCTKKYPSLKIHKDAKPGNKAATYAATKIVWNCHVKNPLMEDIEKVGLLNVVCGNKFIPHNYKTASFDSRRELLAGLIDTDGTLLRSKTNFSFSNKSKQLVEDVAFVARSLGLYVSSPKEFKVPTVCDTAYYRIGIAGDLSIIPTKLSRKKGQSRKVNRDHLTSKFSLTYLGKQEFFGFELDGDHKHLLDDFTVAHNSKSDIKVAECGRYGIPLIASNVGCYAETIIDGKTGFLIETGPLGKKQWAEVLTKVIKDRDLRLEMGRNLKQITDEFFDINKTVHNRLNFIKYHLDHVSKIHDNSSTL